jgi:hypothetical protein
MFDDEILTYRIKFIMDYRNSILVLQQRIFSAELKRKKRQRQTRRKPDIKNKCTM